MCQTAVILTSQLRPMGREGKTMWTSNCASDCSFKRASVEQQVHVSTHLLCTHSPIEIPLSVELSVDVREWGCEEVEVVEVSDELNLTETKDDILVSCPDILYSLFSVLGVWCVCCEWCDGGGLCRLRVWRYTGWNGSGCGQWCCNIQVGVVTDRSSHVYALRHTTLIHADLQDW